VERDQKREGGKVRLGRHSWSKGNVDQFKYIIVAHGNLGGIKRSGSEREKFCSRSTGNSCKANRPTTHDSVHQGQEEEKKEQKKHCLTAMKGSISFASSPYLDKGLGGGELECTEAICSCLLRMPDLS